jgi:hypothetical protein
VGKAGKANNESKTRKAIIIIIIINTPSTVDQDSKYGAMVE